MTMQKNNEWEEFHIQMDCCSSNGEFLNVNKLNPDAGIHKRSSDSTTWEDHASDEWTRRGRSKCSQFQSNQLVEERSVPDTAVRCQWQTIKPTDAL